MEKEVQADNDVRRLNARVVEARAEAAARVARARAAGSSRARPVVGVRANKQAL